MVMRPVRTLVLAGFAAGMLGGAASAASRGEHVLDVRLPCGSIQHVHYTGDVAPRLVLLPAGRVAFGPADMLADAGSPLAEMERISAQMNARADAMLAAARMQMAAARVPGSAAIVRSAAGSLPGGMTSYRVVFTTVNGRTCTRTTGYVPGERGATPRLVNQMSGDGCAAARGSAARHGNAVSIAAPPLRSAKIVPVSAAVPPKPPARQII